MIDLQALAADLQQAPITIFAITDTVLFITLPTEEEDSLCSMHIFDDGEIGIDGRFEYIDDDRWKILRIIDRHRVAAGLADPTADIATGDRNARDAQGGV